MASEGRSKQDVLASTALNADTIYRIRFNNRLAELTEAGAPFTSEDVTSIVGVPNNVVVGALMNAAATMGYIRRQEYVAAEREHRHASIITRWIGTNRKMTKILLAEDVTTVKAHWRCITCQQPASTEPTPSLDPTMAIGKCFVCRKPSTFRRIGD